MGNKMKWDILWFGTRFIKSANHVKCIKSDRKVHLPTPAPSQQPEERKRKGLISMKEKSTSHSNE